MKTRIARDVATARRAGRPMPAAMGTAGWAQAEADRARIRTVLRAPPDWRAPTTTSVPASTTEHGAPSAAPADIVRTCGHTLDPAQPRAGQQAETIAKHGISGSWSSTNSLAHNRSTFVPSQSIGDQATLAVGRLDDPSEGVQRSLCSGAIQAKLTVSRPDDLYEQEADRVAEEVMRMPQPAQFRAEAGETSLAPRFQRLCPACEEKLQRQMPVEPLVRTKREDTGLEQAAADGSNSSVQSVVRSDPIQASLTASGQMRAQKKEGGAVAPQVTPTVEANVRALQGEGSPLAPATRAFFEPRFGADFSQVRVNTGGRAEETAQLLGAKAFTVGRSIAFGAGQYAPASHEGQRLLAHELTHVVQQEGALQRTHGNRATRRILARYTKPKRPWIEQATPASERRARAMDELEKLPDDKLRERREEAAAKAVGFPSAEQKAALEMLEDIEAVAAARGIEPREERYSRYSTGRTQKRMNLRARLEEGVRRLGSFKKAIAEVRYVDFSRETADDLDFFQKEADAFASDFRGRARLTADDMLAGGITAIAEIVRSYGLPWDMTKVAAEDVDRGGSVAKEVADVVKLAGKSPDINLPKYDEKRADLGVSVRRLQDQQKAVKDQFALSESYFELYRRNPRAYGREQAEAARAADRDLTAKRRELETAWAAAESRHPVLMSVRRRGELEKISLDKLATRSADDRMAAVLTELVPKLRDIRRAKRLIISKDLDPLTLPAVVSLTRATMFVPKGSLRDGAINDAVLAAKDKADSTFVLIASFALAAITFIPTAGASLAIPAGIAAVAFAAQSATREWQKYTAQKTLTNTHLDLARSLATEEPSLTSFALSMVMVGVEAAPLAAAFAKAVRLKRLVTAARNPATRRASSSSSSTSSARRTTARRSAGRRWTTSTRPGRGRRPTGRG